MSDYILKIIPSDPFYQISEPLLQKSKVFLEATIHCDSIEVSCRMTPEFIDCGSNLERIRCPNCQSELPFDWWNTAMDKVGERKFTSLETVLPCCGKTVSLNNLDYNFLCGFACCVIEIRNPVCDLKNDILIMLQKILAVNIRFIKAYL